MKSNNFNERLVLRLPKKELQEIDALVAAAKDRGEKSNRSIVGRAAVKQLLAASAITETK